MKIAISSTGKGLSSEVDPRFGRASYLCIFDTSSSELVEVIDNTEGKNASQGAGINVAGLMASKGVDAILTGRVGPKAMAVIDKANIEVISGASGTVEQAVAEFSRGKKSSSVPLTQKEQGTGQSGCRQAGGQGKGLGRRHGGQGRGQNCLR